MVWTSKSGHPSYEVDSEQQSNSPLRTLKFFFESSAGISRPTLLDMGPPCSSNIEFFGNKKFKVYVEDFLSDYLDPGQDLWSQPPLILDYPSSSFNGILCWGIFDFMTHEHTAIIIQRLFDLLKGGGVLMALFDARSEPKRHLMRHKIFNEEQVIHEPVREIQSRSHHYQNREIAKLFSHFEIVKSYYHKNKIREYLFQKLSPTIR